MIMQVNISNKQQSILYLRAIQKKHQLYFDAHKIDILDYVKIINDGTLASVHLLNNDFPFEIQFDIEAVFWR
jgi:hypothetical protein